MRMRHRAACSERSPIRKNLPGVRLAIHVVVRRDRATSCHYFPRWVTAIWLAAGLSALLYSAACRQGVPVVDLGPKPPSPLGTITGIVHGPDATSGMEGRTVEIVNVATGEKHSATTVSNGGFTIQLPKGKYRLDLLLRAGETIVKRPDVVDLDRGDIDSHIEFVVSPARAARPSYRLELQLHPGETIVKRPDVVDLGRGDIDSHIEFVVSGASHASRPANRIDNGLGSPVA